MDRELTPAELRELLPAYAIDAVDEDERAAVESFLAQDADARAEVESLQRTASFLAHTGGPPPVGVWERLEAVIRETPHPEGAVPPPRLVPITAAAPTHPNRRWQVLAVAAVVVAIASFSLWALDRGGSDQATDTAALAQTAATTPGARHAVLRDADGATLARAVVLPDGTGYLTTAALPALDDERTYQLWGVDDHDAISLGVIGANPKVIAFHAANAANALAITNERAGGVVSSNEAPTAVGELHA
ncbi:MAG TPA: anti-sigma factor [Acidimicrobiia bacterium]|nr:anti-sigma factor [Acidimicrobiia bacterium]